MKKKIIKLIWLFIIGSFLGYVVETMITICQGHYEIRKGLIYGPFIPVYGIGAMFYYLVLSHNALKTKNKFVNLLLVFIVTFLLGGIVEYICSFFQEELFGTVSWDYGYLKYNIAGRTSLMHCTYWGLFGVIFFIVFVPLMDIFDSVIDRNITLVITIIVSALMIFDIFISTVAGYRQHERRKNIEATNFLQVFLDKYYPDEYMNKIFVNVRVKD